FLGGLLVHQKVIDEMVQELAIPYTFHSNLIAQWVLERNLDWSVTEQLLPSMKTPTLIIWGKQDVIFDAATHLQRWASAGSPCSHCGDRPGWTSGARRSTRTGRSVAPELF